MIRAAIDPADLASCGAAIRAGSYSFHAASRLLPGPLRDACLALYAFCRLADDAVDEGQDKVAAVLALHARLSAVYQGRPHDGAPDRAFAAVVAAYDMPRALPDALLEGFAWDAAGREYDSFDQLCAYGARVASSVGAMMCVLMGVRDGDALARACDLGLAMQLTNIARDIGTDARMGRIYIPRDWLREAGIAPAQILDAAHDPARMPPAALWPIVVQLLRAADGLYLRSEAGIAALPLGARPAIFAARHIYAGINTAVRRIGLGAFHARAHTSRAQKLGWLALSGARAGLSPLMPHAPRLYAPAHRECAFLVQSAAHPAQTQRRSEALLAILAQLEAKDRRLPLGGNEGAA